MTIWFHDRNNGRKIYCSKSISIRFVPKHWRMCKFFTNGAKKSQGDKCLDVNFYFFSIWFGYTDWDYNKQRTLI